MLLKLCFCVKFPDTDIVGITKFPDVPNQYIMNISSPDVDGLVYTISTCLPFIDGEMSSIPPVGFGIFRGKEFVGLLK